MVQKYENGAGQKLETSLPHLSQHHLPHQAASWALDTRRCASCPARLKAGPSGATWLDPFYIVAVLRLGATAALLGLCSNPVEDLCVALPSSNDFHLPTHAKPSSPSGMAACLFWRCGSMRIAQGATAMEESSFVSNQLPRPGAMSSARPSAPLRTLICVCSAMLAVTMQEVKCMKYFRRCSLLLPGLRAMVPKRSRQRAARC